MPQRLKVSLTSNAESLHNDVFLHRADGGSLSINPTTAASLTGVCTGSPAPYVFEDGPV